MIRPENQLQKPQDHFREPIFKALFPFCYYYFQILSDSFREEKPLWVTLNKGFVIGIRPYVIVRSKEEVYERSLPLSLLGGPRLLWISRANNQEDNPAMKRREQGDPGIHEDKLETKSASHLLQSQSQSRSCCRRSRQFLAPERHVPLAQDLEKLKEKLLWGLQEWQAWQQPPVIKSKPESPDDRWTAPVLGALGQASERNGYWFTFAFPIFMETVLVSLCLELYRQGRLVPGS